LEGSHAVAGMRFPIFRVFYSGTYTFLLLLTFALLAITPGDGIFQSFQNRQRWNAVVIAGVYLLTALIAIFVYATRLFVSRQHLASIPRLFIPIRKGDLSRSVRKVVLDGLTRSALIAYNAHPRDLKEDENPTAKEVEILGTELKTLSGLPDEPPPWGIVSHPGWSAPSSHDLPNVHYEPVLQELPHLIEAKAVSLAPPDPLMDTTPSATPSGQPAIVLPDPIAVSLMQRPAAMTLRDYLSHLTSLGMLNEVELQSSFIDQYEHARFSTRSLSEPAFRDLMATFSTLLRGMAVPDPAVLADAAADNASVLSSDRSISRPSSIRSSSYAESVIKHYNTSQALPQTANRSPIPFENTTFFSSYPESYSSNDGDRDDSGSEHTTYTAWTRPGQRSASRYTAGSRMTRTTMRSTSAGQSLGASQHLGDRTAEGDLESDVGSVIRKVITGSSEMSTLSGGSVIVRRNHDHRATENDEDLVEE
jgi:hypothetical protein